MYNHDARWANLKTTSVLVMIFTDKIFAEYLFVDSRQKGRLAVSLPAGRGIRGRQPLSE